MKVTLTLTHEQLDVLLSQIESTMAQELPRNSQVRGPELALSALDLEPHCFSYDNAQLAPIYLHLVGLWKKQGTLARGVMSPDRQREWGIKHSPIPPRRYGSMGVSRA